MDKIPDINKFKSCKEHLDTNTPCVGCDVPQNLKPVSRKYVNVFFSPMKFITHFTCNTISVRGKIV